MQHVRHATALIGAMLLLGTGTAFAQESHEYAEYHYNPYPQAFFVEATGGWGVQFGETEYLPSGSFEDWQHPLVTGPAFGGTAGVMVLPNVAIIGNYEYTWAQTRTGSVTGVLDSAVGTIDYHTATLGARLYVPVGFGRLRGELAGGVVMPYHTTLELSYGPALAQLPVPITGVGTQTSYYSIGFGGHAALGYEIPLTEGLFMALNLKYKLFEAENAGEVTVLDNVVTDFGATPPTATTAEILHGDGAARPSTNSVQDVRVQLAFGAGF